MSPPTTRPALRTAWSCSATWTARRTAAPPGRSCAARPPGRRRAHGPNLSFRGADAASARSPCGPVPGASQGGRGPVPCCRRREGAHARVRGGRRRRCFNSRARVDLLVPSSVGRTWPCRAPVLLSREPSAAPAPRVTCSPGPCLRAPWPLLPCCDGGLAVPIWSPGPSGHSPLSEGAEASADARGGALWAAWSVRSLWVLV